VCTFDRQLPKSQNRALTIHTGWDAAHLAKLATLMIACVFVLTGCQVLGNWGSAGTTLLDQTGSGSEPSSALQFTAPSGPWTIGWSNNCPQTYAAGYRSLDLLGLATVGNKSVQWYQTHQSEIWSQQFASSIQPDESGSVTVTTHSGKTYLQLNSVCAWHVVVKSGAEIFIPSKASSANSPAVPMASTSG
jgi:hypothetical protein